MQTDLADAGIPQNTVYERAAWPHAVWRRVRATRPGPIGALGLLFVVCLVWLSLARIGLIAFNWDAVRGEPALWRVLLVGLRMDAIVVCQLFALPAMVFLLLPGTLLRRRLTVALLSGAATLLVFMELSTPNFMAEYDRRPDRIFFEYLRYPREVFGTLIQEYWWQFPLVACLTAIAAWWFARVCNRLFAHADRSWATRVAVFPLIAILLFVGARSTFGHRPANASTAAYSANRVVNELGLSSTYSLLSAIYMMRHEADASRLYPSMDFAEALRRVRRYMEPDAAFKSAVIPTLHTSVAARDSTRPPNVVIFVLESVGAEFVGSLGGLPLTPNLDRLSREGVWFTEFYATGTRTVRGLEAIVTGFPPTAAQSVLKLPAAQHEFFTLASLLKRQGYGTEFVYGGEANFDNMGKFFRENGFERVVEQRDYDAPVMLGSWGVSDEDLVAKAHKTFLGYGERPFFALLLSTSNHAPFEFPDGRIDLYESPAATRHNAVKYTDYAVGKLFELAREAAYFDNTIFVIVADHDARVFGADLVPVDRFRIPCLMIGPGVPARRETRIASQIDLAPTLVGLLGIEAEHPMIGRNVLSTDSSAASVPGRAIMQYGDANGFRVGDKVVIHQPQRPPRTFRYANGRLLSAVDDVELQRDALAHLVWADRTYRERLYRLALPEPRSR